MKILICPLLIFATFLAGCSDPTVDASTYESMESSIAKVRKALPETKRARFDEAIELIVVDYISLIGEGAGGCTEY